MSLDTNYMIAPSIEEYFVDKDTGLPLANGKVYFYSDTNRTTLKPIFTISGTAPNYSYVQLDNPVTLSAVGTFQDDNGNNVLPYYFPFTDSTASVIDLYYIQVYSEDNILQFSREAYPNFALGSNSGNSSEITNFVPNGQLLIHNDHPPTATELVPGVSVLEIAPGGVTYEVTQGSTDVDVVTFPRFNNYVSNPTNSPRYAVEVKCTTAGNSAFKNLNIKFPDVNKFGTSDLGAPNLTFLFSGKNNNMGTLPIQMQYIKYFGAGGSTTVTTTLKTININSTYTVYSVAFSFGDNSAYTIGAGDDDYVQISLSLPINTLFDLSFTDFVLTDGQTGITGFPTQTNASMIYESTAGFLPTPAPNGADYYLPIMNSPTGYVVDRSSVGKVFGAFYETAQIGELLCDGSSYETATWSADGIPYSRLYNVLLFDEGLARFGTGATFVTNYLGNVYILTTNDAGAQTAPGNGTPSPTFTFVNSITGSAGFDYYANTSGEDFVLTARCNTAGPTLVAPSAGTSGLPITAYPVNPDGKQVFLLLGEPASTLTNPGGAGKYFLFSNTTINYYMWFHFTNETDPAVGGRTGIRLHLDASMDALEVALSIANAMNGSQIYFIDFVAGSVIPTGSYFTFTANSQLYAVWYKVSETGTQPTVSGALYIEVDILTADTAVQVATKTQAAINGKYFAVPDLRGLFLRGTDPTGIWDLDVVNRYGLMALMGGSRAGSVEPDAYAMHNHPGSVVDFANYGATGGPDTDIFSNRGANNNTNEATVAEEGWTETRPANMSVNWYIKY